MKTGFIKTLFSIVWLSAVMFALWRLASVSQLKANRHYNPVSPPPLSWLNPKITPIVMLGHKAVYDDFMHLWMIQTLGRQDAGELDFDSIYFAIDQTVKQGIKIEVFYLLACVVLYSDFDRPDLCESIAIAGLEKFPSSLRIPMMQGYVFNFLLKEPARAAAYYALAASRKNAPAYAGRVAKKLLNQQPLSEDEIEKLSDKMFRVPGGSGFRRFLKDD